MGRMSSYDIQSKLKDINDYINENLAHQGGTGGPTCKKQFSRSSNENA